MRATFVGLLLVVFSANAQQTVPPILLNLDRVAYNPAISGSNESISFFVAHRATSILRYSQVQGDAFLSKQKLGTGLLVESYQSLLETQNSIRLNTAYRLKTSRGFWQMGIAPVLHQYGLNTNNLIIRSQDDGLTPTGFNHWSLNFNAGILYKIPQLLLSLSAQNISKSLNPLSSQYGYLIEYQMYSFFAAYTIKLGKYWQYMPQLYVQSVRNQGTFIAIAQQLKHEYFFIGLQYGLPSAWLGNAGLKFEPDQNRYQVSIGYSIAQPTNGLQNALIHQVFLVFGLGQPKDAKGTELPQYKSPIYF